tara:strand:+ start:650 stop:1057 length:408 start_codon:yes stop_codon:yes gene_type:complete
MSKIVWTNGCFDLLHPGHIELFKICRSLGDQVIVGLDSDEKVKRDKGDSRPINDFQFRKTMLESIRYIDVVVGFNTREELENLIELYNPDILIDGGDWRNDDGVGRQFAKEVRFFDRIGSFSSSKIIETCVNARS